MNVCLYVLIISFVTLVNCLPVKEKFKTGYETCPTGLKDKLNVHLVCHTHNDVGWLKTVDQYFYGAKNNIQNAGVQYILDSVVQALKYDKTKRFIYVETAFFSRWWNEQHDSVHHAIKKLVCNGQLEFIGGGWSMNDEAATHYNSIIDQMTFGLRVLNDTFGACGVPKVAWQIDPFGHSKEQASLFAQMYYDGLFFGRLDYQDKDLREQTKTMEHVWMPSLMNLGHSVDLFTGALPNSYSPPAGFCYDILCDDPPIMDDPNLKDYNVNERVSAFIDIAEEQAKSYATNHIVMTMGNDFNYQNAHTWYKNLDKLIKHVNERAKSYATNHIVMTMGEDFNYQNAHTWFKNLDKLIKHVNERQKNGSRVNVFYSTPSCYLYALNKANVTWSTKTDDFLPYASDPHAYWTGYFTSRPSIKRYERVGNNKLQVCKQLAARIDIEEITLDFMRKAMGIMQHHDAITGTAKQHVTNDYAETLASAIETCHDIVTEAYEKLMPVDKKVNTSQPLKQYFCNYLNISSCNFTEENIPIAVTIYNPLAWNVSEYIRLPVTGKAYNVTDYNLQLIESQLVPIPPPVLNIPGRKSKAQSEIVFKVDLPPLGYGTYLIRNTSSEQVLKAQSSQVRVKADGDWIMKNEFLTVVVDGKSGLLKQLQLVDGFNLTVNQSFYWYRGMNGNNSEFDFRASGAYIFRPNGTEPLPLGNNVTLTYVNGSLVQEIHQTFTPWLSQSIRLYKGVKNVELKWVVGPIPYEDNVGKEIITRFDTDLATNAEFYTDSNGREMVKRKRNYRETWTLNVTEPVSGNYYPVNSRIFIRDSKTTHRQFTVLTDRSQGGSSIKDGSIELMVHRRLFMDDAFGVGEALNETGVDGRGLVITGSHFLVLDYMNHSAAIHRPLAQKLYLQPQISFMTYNMSDEALKKSLNLFSPGLKTPFPPNVHLLTLEPWKRDTYLIRLEHFFGFDEDLNLSRPTNVSLKDRFTNFEILNLDETTLSANQYLEKAKRLTWNINKNGIHTTTGYKGYRKDKDLADLNIYLDSMQIRTFVAKIKAK